MNDKKAKQLYCWFEQFEIEDHINPNICINQSLIQRNVLTLFNPMKAEKGEEAGEENLKLAELVHEV